MEKKLGKKFNLMFFAVLIFSFGYLFYGISLTSAESTGCCEVDSNGVQCSTTTESDCSSQNFAGNTQCESTSFCQRGCCYDDSTGVYDQNVLQSSCNLDWNNDPNCNLPGAAEGCCILGSSTIYETGGRCAIDSVQRGYEGIDWRSDLNEAQCVTFSQSQDEGACVLNGGNCKFTTGGNCASLGGDFSPDYLCTAEELETSCEKTTETTCVDGKYGVYFTDTCGNIANIYDSSKTSDQTYWETAITQENSCGANDEEGNANSQDCGNCNLQAGGLCSSAEEDNFSPDDGDYYCKEVSCEFDGDNYENGESWCVYDGIIGNSNDVPGSRHWRYVCNQGKVEIDPCADARTQICLQSNTEENGGTIFRNAACLTNTGDKCLEINSETNNPERLEELCNEEANCRVNYVTVTDDFQFKTCIPRFPQGFDFKDEQAQENSANACKRASATCEIQRRKNNLGRCRIRKNSGCLDIKFAEEMNNLCRGMGDCGGDINLNNDFVSNYQTRLVPGYGRTPPRISSGYINDLEDFGSQNNNLEGILIILENYLDYMSILGVIIYDPSYNATAAENTNLLLIDQLYSQEGYNHTVSVVPPEMGSSGLFNWFGGCTNMKLTYSCKAWQPPRGGDACDLCNDDPLKPCSKYRCESYGATCELANIGTGEELCYDAGVDDANPPILAPQIGYISATENYSNITENGFSITSTEGECLEAYSPIHFGITTDEVSNCRYDFEMQTFENMSYDMENGLASYNHTPHQVPFYLPDPSHGESQGLNWSGELDLYVKCQDGNGNENPNFYKVSMCVNQGPDLTPPIIIATSPENNSRISFDSTAEEVEFITTELSTCKWADNDTDYSLMTNQLVCDEIFNEPSSTQGYSCKTNLTITDTKTTKYIRCADQPWYEETNDSLRNSNSQSFVYTLNQPSQKIKIDSISPSSDFKTATDTTTVNLEVQTIGGGNTHTCSYSFSGYERMAPFFETGLGNIHNQPSLNLFAKKHEIFIECKDETGDTEQQTSTFEIIKDESDAKITRIWQEEGEIIFLTEESAECKFSEETCNFNWENGTLTGTGRTHTIDAIRGRTYRIKCLDDFGNKPRGCSTIIRAS